MTEFFPRPRAVVIADWLLRLSILAHALGLVRALFTRVGTSLGSIALLEWDVSHAAILVAEKSGSAILLAAAVSLLFRPTASALLVIAATIFIESIAGYRAGGSHFSELTPCAHALRYLTPLALIPLVPQTACPGSAAARHRISAWILRIGLATVFATHGYEAWKLHPAFTDFIIATARNLSALEITEATAATMLKVIAAVDFLVAAWVILRPHRGLLAWLSLWGLVTALARPVSLGLASYPEVLLRASHILAPVAIGFLLFGRHRAANPPSNPDSDDALVLDPAPGTIASDESAV